MAKLSISKAWDETLAFVRRERRLITPVVLALLVVPIVIVVLIRPTAPPGELPEPGGWMLAGLFALVVNLIGEMAIMRLAIGWEGRLADALRLAAGRVWIVLLAFLLLGTFLTLALVPLVIIIGLGAGADQLARGPTPAMAVTAGLAFFLLMARFVPIAALAMNEQHGPWSIIKRCWQLTRGHFWRLLGFFVLFLLAARILSSVVELMVAFIATLALGPTDPMTVSRLLVAIAVGLTEGLSQVVYAVMVARVYAQLAHQPTVPEVHQNKN